MDAMRRLKLTILKLRLTHINNNLPKGLFFLHVCSLFPIFLLEPTEEVWQREPGAQKTQYSC